AHRVTMDVSSKAIELDDKQVAAPELQQATSDKFAELAQKFAELAQRAIEKPPLEVTDVIYVENKDHQDALHEERQAGLQTGIREVPLEGGTEVESFEEDCSPPESERGRTDE